MSKKINIGETLMAQHLTELGLKFRQQVKFCDTRRWKLDFLLGENGIAIEVDGYFKGRHGAGWGSDNEKANWATSMGYRVLRFSTQEVKTGKAKEFLKQWFK
jgi:very-short-patch-repair endonuclease